MKSTPHGTAAIMLALLASPCFAESGNWSADVSGNWSNPANWSPGPVADDVGFTAGFTNDLTVTRTVTLDTSRSIGQLTFADADTATPAGWVLAGTSPLTLAVTAGSPVISVSALAANQVAQVSTPLAGAAFVKKGAGTLVLAGANAFTTATLAFASENAGAVRVTRGDALGGIATVAMPGTNTNIARIELAGNITLVPALTTAGRGPDSVFLKNLSDVNAWSGNITINNTGGSYSIESAAGTLTLGGTLFTSVATARTFVLTGSGNGVVTGVVVNGSGTISVQKEGAGTWTFLGANTYTGTTTITAGQLVVGNGGQLGTGAVSNNAQLVFSQANDLTVANAIGGTGTVVAGGAGALTLSGASSHSGGTTVTGTGKVSVANNSALGTGLVMLGATPGASQTWFHLAGGRTLPNDFEIRTQRWIIDGTTVNGNAAGPLTVTGAVYLNQAGAKDIYCSQPLTLSGPLTSTGGLTKQGGSALTLAGAATYGGATGVVAGTLFVNGSITSPGTTTVGSGAVLGGTGTISGPVSISSGGDLVPGNNGAGKLSTGSLTLGATSELRIAAGAPDDATNSQVTVNGNLSLNGTLQLIAKAGFGAGIYTVATYTGTLTGSGFQSIVAPAGYVANVIASVPGQLRLQVFSATAISPANNAMLSFADSVILYWAPVAGVVSYDVYLGTSAAGVAGATTATAGTYLGRMTADEMAASGFSNGVTNYWRVDYILADGSVFKGATWNFTLVKEQDLMADTWVATDALNRVLPGAAQVGPPRDDRPVAIFYFLWHTKNNLGSDGPRDNTDEINRLGGYTDPRNPWADNPLWMSGSNGRSWYWGEPEAGYYSSDDEWVIRRHISLLVAAGVDILAFDNTNGHPESYQAHYTKIAETIRKMRREGMKIDLKFLFVTHGGTGGSPSTMTWLYDNFYKPGLYPEMWPMWNGKPAMMGYPDGLGGGDVPVSDEVRNFFTFRSGWANVSSLQREWQWIDSTSPQNWGYDTRTDIPEQVPVACGGWCNGNLGRSYYNRSQPAYDKFHLTTGRTEGQGRFFAEQSFYGLKLDPKLLFITGWNEWWAGSWTAPSAGGGYNVLNNPCAVNQRYFVDNYNEEYSRDIEPAKGGVGDNYYYQMVGANRQRKGARPLPLATPAKTVADVGGFTGVGPVYYDAPDETLPRNAPTTFSNLPNYTNTSGRNDFRVLKVARDAVNLYFYAETKAAITAAAGENWMLLFLDTDQSRATGWEGYDYALNLGGSGQVKRFSGTTWTPTAAGSATVAVTGNQMMITVPRATVGLTADPLRFDFHWADNLQTLGDISDFGTSGDSAPERRFNYRYQAAPEEVVTLRTDGFEPGDDSAQGTGSSWGETFAAGSQWKIAATTPYSGDRCLVATGAATTTDAGGTLINRAGTAGFSSVRVAFRYKLANVQDAQNIQIYYRNSSNQWIAVRELGRDQFHATGQAWGYDERQNVWLYFSDARLNSGADAAFFHSQFAVHIQVKGLNSTTQTIALDDFQITGIRPVIAPTAATSPTPANSASGIATTTALGWSSGANASSQQVYFGTPGNLQLLATVDGAASSQTPAPLVSNTTYAWRVDSTNAAGTTAGPAWTFTTAPPPNSVPTLAPVQDRSVVAGQSISFTAVATDPDSPGQTLSFSLQGAPSGASLQVGTGQFSWRPTQSQAPGVYPMTITVTDNGVPAQSAQRAFSVQVAKPAPPKALMLERAADGTFRFQITGDAGPDYRVFVSENLVQWELLQTFLAPVPPFLFEDSGAKTLPRRFYKFELGP